MNRSFTDYFCQRCKTTHKQEHACWCDTCHPVIVAEMNAKISMPALCVGVPGNATYINWIIPPKSTRLRRARFVAATVEDAPILSDDLKSKVATGSVPSGFPPWQP